MKLFNTMSRTVETVEPLETGRIKMYTCGLTVYSQPQIGNWVAYIYSDVLLRALRAHGFDVMRVQNITDVGHLVSDDDDGEDKMEKGARREGLTAWDVATKYSTIAEHEAYELLGLIRPDALVPATSLIDEQIAFARTLDEKGYLYRIDDGMYFDTSKLHDYGKLARLDIAGLQAGVRVDMAGKKRATDFAVWKFSPVGQHRDMEWESPWGTGFPGWHLECSVIARQNLGDQLDIHTGGIDHIPVHHSNEIAQTESVTGKEFVKYWFHNNHMKVNGTKLSKSLGNSYTLQDILDKGIDLDAFKLLVLSSHYRSEGNFTWGILEASRNRLDHWRSIAALRHQAHTTLDDKRDTNVPSYAALSALNEAIGNDLDTPAVLRLIDETFSQVEASPLDAIDRAALSDLIETIDSLLGLHLIKTTPDLTDDQKQRLLERERAREQHDWTRSDELRDAFKSDGIGLNDSMNGVRWYYL